MLRAIFAYSFKHFLFYMNTTKINIAIDGYSSCGKSTLAKALAKKLNYTYIDSGAMYRAVTLYFIENNIDLKDKNRISDALQNIDIQLVYNEVASTVMLNGRDVSQTIRELMVANLVSEVASIKEVRRFAVQQQQALGKNGGVVMDGRDIGTVVFPKAELKIFMTANEEIRTQRRFDELIPSNPNITMDEVRANLKHRDTIDTTRAIDPLVKAKTARILDNSYLNKEEQLAIVMEWYEQIIETISVT